MTQADCIEVTHGSLTVDVPRRLFKGASCEIDREAAEPFMRMLMGRYPWLTASSVEVLMNRAQKEMVRVLDEETKGRSHSRELAESGRLEDAIAHMRLHLEMDPDDADSWYALGNLLCKAGNAEEGYKALNRGRTLAANRRRGR